MLTCLGRTGDGRPILILGMTSENFTRMLADEPIRIDTATLGGVGPNPIIALHGGSNQAALVDQLLSAGLVTEEGAEQMREAAAALDDRTGVPGTRVGRVARPSAGN